MYRFLEEEAKKQGNIEGITQKALPLLSEQAEPQKVEDDWITNFFDKSRIVADREMQELWARVLAGEANAPGTFAKRTVNLLGDLDKSDAELFMKLCGFGWQIGNIVPLVFDVQHKIYNQHGIDFGSLAHLESLGLIQFDNLAGYKRLQLPKQFSISYYGTPIPMRLPKESDNELPVGHVLLTRAGQQLAPVCGSQPVDDFLKFATDHWGPLVAGTPEPSG